jgi:hypothetical protein
MARSYSSRSTRVVRATQFSWPQQQMQLFTILVLATAGVLIGVFAVFIQIQNQMEIPTPWYALLFVASMSNPLTRPRLFPFGITTGALTILFMAILMILSQNSTLTPGICIVFCFMLFVLYLTALIETGVQLFGAGNVSANCQNIVFNNPVKGPGYQTLAWLQQQNICE